MTFPGNRGHGKARFQENTHFSVGSDVPTAVLKGTELVRNHYTTEEKCAFV
jgi:hypothetical protein